MAEGKPVPAGTYDVQGRGMAQLETDLAAGQVTSEQLVRLYLARIAALDHAGPTLRSVLAVKLTPADIILEVTETGVTKDLVDIEMMAHGGSVIEIVREVGTWRVVEGSKYARRITVETEMRIAGPAAGHERMKTGGDPTGTRVRGMFNNCAGGITPWGTWLTCEENINGYFWNKAAGQASPEALGIEDDVVEALRDQRLHRCRSEIGVVGVAGWFVVRNRPVQQAVLILEL